MEAASTCISPGADDLVQELKQAGVEVTACYQCGRCSAGCPLAEFFDLRPMQVVRLCAYGQGEPVLDSHAIWLCASCETCTTRCPNGIDIAHLMDVLRSRALREGRPAAESRIQTFHRAFLNSIRRHGRVYEVGMIAGYKLRSGDLMGDVGLGLEMFKRGKLSLLPTRIKGRRQVRELFQRRQKPGE